MKRQGKSNETSQDKQVNTLESLWAKRRKVDELSNATSTTSNKSTAVISDAPTTSSQPPQDRAQPIVSNDGLSSDISASADHPPVRSILSSYPVNQENRSFQPQWYHHHPWLEYSVKNDAAYCYYCRHFGESLQTKRLQSDAFTTGFNGWRRALEKDRGFDKHLKSAFHITATQNYEEYKKRCHSNSVVDLIDRSRTELIKQNREKLKKVCSTVLLCARQMIALRGHEENKE